MDDFKNPDEFESMNSTHPKKIMIRIMMTMNMKTIVTCADALSLSQVSFCSYPMV